MKSRIWLVCVALTASANVLAGTPFPTKNTAYFTGSDFDVRYENTLVAVEGKIIRIEKGPGDNSLFEISLPPPISRTVWVGSLVADSQSQLEVGHIVRVLGYLQRVLPDDTLTKAVTKDAYSILGFCFLDVSSKKGLFLPAGIKQCEGWQAGLIPEDLGE